MSNEEWKALLVSIAADAIGGLLTEVILAIVSKAKARRTQPGKHVRQANQ